MNVPTLQIGTIEHYIIVPEMFLCLMYLNWFTFPAESPVHNNTRNSTLYLQPRADARYSHNNRPFSTTIHHRCLCLSCVRECEYILSIVHYCCESCEWRGSVLGRHWARAKWVPVLSTLDVVLTPAEIGQCGKPWELLCQCDNKAHKTPTRSHVILF